MLSAPRAHGEAPAPWVRAGVGTWARFVDVGFDPLGNVFVAGCFTDSLAFGDTTIQASGFALLKLDAAGEVVWSVAQEGSCPSRFAVGPSGETYVGGEEWGSLAIGDTVLTVYGLWAARYDEAGNFDWARLVSDDNFFDGLNSIQTTSAGHMLIAGQFDGALHYGHTVLRCPAHYCGYALEYDAAGQPVWAIYPALSDPLAAADAAGNTYAGSASSITKYDAAKNPVWTAAPNVIEGFVVGTIDVNSAGVVGLTGILHGTAEFGSTTLVASSFKNAFVAKLAPNGQFLWARTVPIEGASGLQLMDATLRAAIDEEGNVYLSGTSLLESSPEIFVVAKVDANGEFQWLQRAVSTASTRGLGCDVSLTGRFAAVGSYDAATTLGGQGLPIPPTGESAFLALYPPQAPTAVQPPQRPQPALSLRTGPNPFNPRTTLAYTLSGAGQVRLAIYSLNGELVRVLVDQPQVAGAYSVVWDGRNTVGRPMASGVYLSVLDAGGDRRTQKLALLK